MQLRGRKCVISHVVSVDQRICRNRDSLAGRPLAFCASAKAKLNTKKKEEEEKKQEKN